MLPLFPQSFFLLFLAPAEPRFLSKGQAQSLMMCYLGRIRSCLTEPCTKRGRPSSQGPSPFDPPPCGVAPYGVTRSKGLPLSLQLGFCYFAASKNQSLVLYMLFWGHLTGMDYTLEFGLVFPCTGAAFTVGLRCL